MCHQHPSLRKANKTKLRRVINRLGMLTWAETNSLTKQQLVNMITPTYAITGDSNATHKAMVNPLIGGFILDRHGTMD